jgi:NAD(P)-dependent dehydrogenase (short-subunit alcohol dehydrogenase family)
LSKHQQKGLLEMSSCENLRAVVTGGSRGIGYAIAHELAEKGAAVSICARGTAALASAETRLKKLGRPVYSESLDVSDADALAGWIKMSARVLGGIDIVVHSASALIVEGEEGWAANFAVDLLGANRVVNAALPYLEASPAASVVFMSSTAGLEHFIGAPPYAAMKAGLIAHGNDLAHTLAAKGVRVNCVSPGAVHFEGGFWDQASQQMPELYDAAVQRTAMGRLGTPDEIARCVRFLASPESSYVTGSNFVVDGGFTYSA